MYTPLLKKSPANLENNSDIRTNDNFRKTQMIRSGDKIIAFSKKCRIS
jgi:hypothetical protein